MMFLNDFLDNAIKRWLFIFSENEGFKVPILCKRIVRGELIFYRKIIKVRNR